MTTLADEMRAEAIKNSGGEPAFRTLCGWKFGLSYGATPLPTREQFEVLGPSVFSRCGVDPKMPGLRTYEEFIALVGERQAQGKGQDTWIFSASLHPRGRSSTEKDWDYLGSMVAAVRAPLNSCQTPIETTHPNAVHYWVWKDGESVSVPKKEKSS